MSEPDDNILLATLDEGFKDVTVTVIGSFPVVGGLAAAFLNKIYSDEKEAKAQKGLLDLENRIKEYSVGLVDQEHLANMQNLMAGLEHRVHVYTNTKAPEKGLHLINLCDELVGVTESFYGKAQNPERHYLLFVAFATLHLAALRDMAYCWDAANWDPKAKTVAVLNNNADEHTKDLFNWYETYMKYLTEIRDRLLDWRLNNISENVGENTVWYDRGPELGGDTYINFEWHDTISGLKWTASTSDAGFNESNAAETRRARGNQTLGVDRLSMADENTQTFTHEGEEIESYAWRLAREFESAKLWKYCCYPQGLEEDPPKVLWKVVRLDFDKDNRATLVWTHVAGGAGSEYTFPLNDYLGADEQGLLWWGYSGLWPQNLKGLRVDGTTLCELGYDLSLDQRLAVVEVGELRFMPKAFADLDTWTFGLDI